MKAHLFDTHLVVPRSRLFAKVKYQGHNFQRMAIALAIDTSCSHYFYKCQLLELYSLICPYKGKGEQL